MKSNRHLFALQNLVVGMTALLFMSGAQAAPISIIGYDVTDASLSGAGGWNHDYTGTITPTVVGADYSGGTGTMADGIISTSESNNQLFASNTPLLSITVFLDDFYTLNTIELWGGNNTGNVIPGAITAADFTIAGTSLNLPGVPFGLSGAVQLVNDRFILSGTSVDSLVTDRFTISSVSAPRLSDRFSITEIVVYGSTATVPVPAAFWLFASGLLGLIGVSKRKKA